MRPTETCVRVLVMTAISLSAAVAAPAVPRADYKVIANESVTVLHLSPDELRGVLLATRTSLADGGHVEPVLLRSGGVQDAFVRQVTGKSPAGLENYYRSLVFTGKGAMPKMLASDAAMVAYVRVTKGAIGYVSSGSPTEGVKVLELR
ncbi:MAG: hypothetical protein ABI868_11015 [Acidobacteriota bacterium]